MPLQLLDACKRRCKARSAHSEHDRIRLDHSIRRLGDKAVHRIFEAQTDKLALDEIHSEPLRSFDALRGKFFARQRLAKSIVVFDALRLFERTDAVRDDRNRRTAAFRVNSRRNACRPLSNDKNTLHQ